MVNWKKFFLFIGIPILAFYIFLIVIFYAFIAILFLLALLMGICCLRFSKKKIYPGLTKLALAMFLFFTVLISNPLYWPSQIVRHVDTSLVIQPNDPLVMQLNSTAPGYMWDYLNQTYNVTPSYFYSNMTDDERLENMTDYIIKDVIIYHFIPEVYGVIDYVSTPSEAITHGKGDCHSRTIVMVSFFIYMGYDAWACEAPYHWYTCVYLEGVTHYYYRLNWSDPQIMFNDTHMIHTMNVFERLGDVVFGYRFYQKIHELFSISSVQFVLYPMIFGIGFIMTLAIRCTVSEKKNYLKNGLLSSLFILIGFLIALCLSEIYFPQLFIHQAVFIIMVASIILAAQSAHSDLGGRLFSRHK